MLFQTQHLEILFACFFMFVSAAQPSSLPTDQNSLLNPSLETNNVETARSAFKPYRPTPRYPSNRFCPLMNEAPGPLPLHSTEDTYSHYRNESQVSFNSQHHSSPDALPTLSYNIASMMNHSTSLSFLQQKYSEQLRNLNNAFCLNSRNFSERNHPQSAGNGFETYVQGSEVHIPSTRSISHTPWGLNPQPACENKHRHQQNTDPSLLWSNDNSLRMGSESRQRVPSTGSSASYPLQDPPILPTHSVSTTVDSNLPKREKVCRSKKREPPQHGKKTLKSCGLSDHTKTRPSHATKRGKSVLPVTYRPLPSKQKLKCSTMTPGRSETLRASRNAAEYSQKFSNDPFKFMVDQIYDNIIRSSQVENISPTVQSRSSETHSPKNQLVSQHTPKNQLVSRHTPKVVEIHSQQITTNYQSVPPQYSSQRPKTQPYWQHSALGPNTPIDDLRSQNVSSAKGSCCADDNIQGMEQSTPDKSENQTDHTKESCNFDTNGYLSLISPLILPLLSETSYSGFMNMIKNTHLRNTENGSFIFSLIIMREINKELKVQTVQLLHRFVMNQSRVADLFSEIHAPENLRSEDLVFLIIGLKLYSIVTDFTKSFIENFPDSCLVLQDYTCKTNDCCFNELCRKLTPFDNQPVENNECPLSFLTTNSRIGEVRINFVHTALNLLNDHISNTNSSQQLRFFDNISVKKPAVLFIILSLILDRCPVALCEKFYRLWQLSSSDRNSIETFQAVLSKSSSIVEILTGRKQV